MATAAGGTHSTGMHFCVIVFFIKSTNVVGCCHSQKKYNRYCKFIRFYKNCDRITVICHI